jgi:transposase
VDGLFLLYNSVPGYAWIKRGSDRWIKSNTGRKRVNLLGSYSPISTTTEILQTTEPCTADTVIQLLVQIRQACLRANRIVVIMDNVRYQRAKKVKAYAEQAHIELLYLPSYSPNLNLIERLWDYLKDLLVRNHYYESFVLFCAMISSTLKTLKDRKAEWLSRMTENFQILNCA